MRDLRVCRSTVRRYLSFCVMSSASAGLTGKEAFSPTEFVFVRQGDGSSLSSEAIHDFVFVIVPVVPKDDKDVLKWFVGGVTPIILGSCVNDPATLAFICMANIWFTPFDEVRGLNTCECTFSGPFSSAREPGAGAVTGFSQLPGGARVEGLLKRSNEPDSTIS